ncbi:alanine racemase [Acetobacterium woodii]|uniref:Alanine racemase n=1 Tax=Acetobacterium woodii (strain ATCC 29683 / DSM 1030 / JCM 2381 / KCTC 1655 / WB1) TaxID=931626 RepID=H6LH33_ACEWD|nr:alanine racemase [Acetobacterium woodii]AFA47171.1 alanine racemase Alr [Acetobacterium woodii DSM 1030]
MEELTLRPTWAEIDLDALTNNYEEIRRIVGPNVKILGVVKADAYGHGSLECARTLCRAGADMLAVAFIDEAIALRQGGITEQILLLGYTAKEHIPDLIRWDVIPGVYQMDFAIALSDYCQETGTHHPIHVKLDTGMGRIGIDWECASTEIKAMNELPGIEIQGLYSHFSTADATDKSYTKKQLGRFKQVISELQAMNIEIPIKHIANSAAIFDVDVEGVHFDMVRPGIILYGLYPSSEVDRTKIDLKPVMTLKSTIVHLKTIHPGDSLSYGNRFVAKTDRLIGTLPIGYADGFTRMLNGKATIWHDGQQAPIVGSICMDQCMTDLTDLKAVSLYDEVEIFGNNISADVLADSLGTINYEITCMVNKRVPRVYLKDGHPQFIRRDILDHNINNDHY